MKKVVLSAPLLTQSGYGVHALQIFRYLLTVPNIDLKVDCVQWGDTDWIVDENRENGLIKEVLKRASTHSSPPDVSIQLKLPNEWVPVPGAINIGMSAVVESDKCNPSWVQACNQMTMVIVPSEHAKQCLQNSGMVLVPIHVIPESFIDTIATDFTPTSFEFSTPFNFLMFGQITGNNSENDRKNTFNTLKILCETFKDDKDVGVILKTNMGNNSHVDRYRTNSLLDTVIKQCRKSDFPKIHVIHGDLTDIDVASLYVHPSVKALVSLTHGEGFGLPILEASASGLPVIATGWSGHMDYLKKGKFMNVSYTLGEVHPSRIDGAIFLPGVRWAYPDENVTKKHLTKFRNEPQIPQQWAKDLQSKILQSHNLNSICEAYASVIGESLK